MLGQTGVVLNIEEILLKRRLLMKKIIVLLIAVTLLIPAFAFSREKRVKYQVVEVSNGGIITGKIKSSTKVEDPVLPINIKDKSDPQETELEKKTCGSSQQANMYVLSAANEVANAMVIVEDVKEGKAAPQQDTFIDNVNCRFEPLISIAYLNSDFVIKNSDPLLHNTSLGKIVREGVRRTVYNLALPFKDQVIKKPIRVAGLINVKCDAHPWMRAYLYGSRHPYVAITDASGNFEIKDLLPGNYTVRVWHEGFEEIVKEVEVKAGASAELNVTFAETITPDFMSGL